MTAGRLWTDFYTFENWPETFAKWPLAKRPVSVNSTRTWQDKCICLSMSWHANAGTEITHNKLAHFWKHRSKTLSCELPEDEDGEKAVLLLCVLVRVANVHSKTILTKTNPAAILAEGMLPLMLWRLENRREDWSQADETTSYKSVNSR